MATYSQEQEERAAKVAERLSTVMLEDRFCATVTESHTGGKIATQPTATPDSSPRFPGGVVCYFSKVQHRALENPPGPARSQQTPHPRLSSENRMTGADVVVAASGAGGQSRHEPGTTWVAVIVVGDVRSELHHIPCQPLEVLVRTKQRDLEMT
ncbi:CinA family protein [Georgenia sp. Z1491]|uniref:CinA family protein n=1 Tax=Georgenia sp. Z1491 TaxID=3416707 RepID=UPI003CF2BD61